METSKIENKTSEAKDEVLSINGLAYKFIAASTLEEEAQTEQESSEYALEHEDATEEIVALNVEVSDEEAAFQGAIESLSNELPTARKIIGTDTRKRVRNVGDIKQAPFRWICSLKSFFRDPDNPSQVVELEGGTGLLIGVNHVLTAAHVVYAEITGSRGTKQKQKALRTRVYVGRDGMDATAIVRANSHSYAYPKAFTKDLDARWDYAIIKLKEKIGSKRFKKLDNQVLGYWGSTKWGQNTKIEALSASYLRTQILNVGGYPKNKRGLQYLAYNKVKEVPPTLKGKPVNQLITYLVDTTEGQSGAPVWKYIKSTGKRYLVAVHRGACHANLDGCIKSGKATSNMGVLITSTVIKQIRTWIKTM